MDHSTPSESFGDKTNFTYLPRSSKIPGSLHELDQALSQKQVYEYVFVRDFAPTERRICYHYIQELQKGLLRPAVLCTYTVGSSIGNYHFIWAILEHVTLEAALNENARLLEEIKSQVPVFHRRALKAEFVSKFGRLVHDAPLGTLQEIYRNLTGDRSSSWTSDEKEVDAQIRQALEMEDPELLLDLHEFIKHCCQVRKYSFCVKKCGSPEFTLCKPVRMDPELFKSIHFLPDPLIGEDNHYKCFSDVYGSTTTKRDCPSSQSKAKKLLSFSPSKQHVLNVDTMVQCEECSMWCLLFSRKKLSVHDNS